MEIIPEILATLTLFGGIAVAIFFIFAIYEKLSRKNLWFMNDIRTFTKEHALLLAFIVAFIATSGSLFYSEILGYIPCKLCWIQRIFMYPLVILLGIAVLKRDIRIKRYVVLLSIIGGIIAVYHYIIQRLEYANACFANSAVPCIVKYTFKYGYITIPMMALTAFVLIILILNIKKE